MIDETISTQQAQNFYNRLGHRYDWTTFFESAAKERALARLNLQPGLAVLDVGAGTGRALDEIQEAVGAAGSAVGIDASFVMSQLAGSRSQAGALMAEANRLPFKSDNFDRIYAAYLLDLLPVATIPEILLEFKRVLRPDGFMVLLSLTEGGDAISKSIVAGWKALYRVAPLACGGCRPLQLRSLIEAAGLEIQSLEIVQQWGVASELAVVK